MRQLLDHAAENGYGLPAFNVDNPEQVRVVTSAAADVGAPVTPQASAGAREFAGEAFVKDLILAALEAYPKVTLGCARTAARLRTRARARSTSASAR